VIENFELFRRLFNLEEEDEAALGSAQAIIARLRRRELYKYVTDALIPQVGGWVGGWRGGWCGGWLEG
jgi:hypothetical protein